MIGLGGAHDAIMQMRVLVACHTIHRDYNYAVEGMCYDAL